MEELTIDNTPVTNEKDQEAVIEAVLFTMGSAVELKQLATAIGQDKETAKAAVERLMKRYQTGKHGMEILQLEDSYQMCTQSKYYSNLIRIASAPKKQVLSDIVLETLSIIAYRQPVTKLEIEKIRGVKSDHAVTVWWNTTWFMRQAVWMHRDVRRSSPLRKNLCAASALAP